MRNHQSGSVVPPFLIANLDSQNQVVSLPIDYTLQIQASSSLESLFAPIFSLEKEVKA